MTLNTIVIAHVDQVLAITIEVSIYENLCLICSSSTTPLILTNVSKFEKAVTLNSFFSVYFTQDDVLCR